MLFLLMRARQLTSAFSAKYAFHDSVRLNASQKTPHSESAAAAIKTNLRPRGRPKRLPKAHRQIVPMFEAKHEYGNLADNSTRCIDAHTAAGTRTASSSPPPAGSTTRRIVPPSIVSNIRRLLNRDVNGEPSHGQAMSQEESTACTRRSTSKGGRCAQSRRPPACQRKMHAALTRRCSTLRDRCPRLYAQSWDFAAGRPTSAEGQKHATGLVCQSPANVVLEARKSDQKYGGFDWLFCITIC